MEIAILNHKDLCVDIIKTAPNLESKQEIEEYIKSQGFDLNTIDWLIDPNHKRIHVNIWKPIYDKVK